MVDYILDATMMGIDETKGVKPYTWILVIGTLMVLLAVVLFLQVETVDSQESKPHRLRVQDVVIELNANCQTACHSSATTPINHVAVYAAASPVAYHDDVRLRPETFAIPSPAGLKTQIDTELRDLGARILDSPAAEEQQYERVVEEFLRIYEESRDNNDLVSQIRLLQAVDDISQLLTWLEYQAQGPEWGEAPSAPVRGEMAAAQTSSPVPHTIAPNSLTVFSVRFAYHSTFEDEQAVVLSPVMRLSYRRGPPAGVHLDSVL